MLNLWLNGIGGKTKALIRMQLQQVEGTGTVRGVSLETLFKIADVLGLPPSKLLEDD